MKNINLLIVTGPTASGKTSLAAHLAYRLDSEIISADSRQVYRQMDLGTGKDYGDYTVEGTKIPYHLIDIREPGYKYNVYEFQQDFSVAFQHIAAKGKLPLLVGGTGMYIEAVTKGYKLIQVPVNKSLRERLDHYPLSELVAILREMRPDLHNTTDTKHKKRTIRAIEIAEYYKENEEIDMSFPEIIPLIIGVKYDRQSRRRMISVRLRHRLAHGMIDEVRKLLHTLSPEDLLFYGLEYKFITLYLTGKLKREEMEQKLETAIHQFAKRQMTWFRKMEREGTKIHWLDGHMPLADKIKRVQKVLEDHKITINKFN